MLLPCNLFSFISSTKLFSIDFSVSGECMKYLVLTSFHVVNIILRIGFFPVLVRVLWEILQGRILRLMLFCMCIALKLPLCRNVTPTSYLGRWSFSIWADTREAISSLIRCLPWLSSWLLEDDLYFSCEKTELIFSWLPLPSEKCFGLCTAHG